MILVLILGIAAGIFMGCVTDSIIIGVIVGFVGTAFLAGKWNDAGATVNMATQHQRDKEIIKELKKMNEE